MITTSVSSGRHRRTKGGRHRATPLQELTRTVTRAVAYLLGRRPYPPLHCKVNRAEDTQRFAPVAAPELLAVAS
jgi:hypothetical protein